MTASLTQPTPKEISPFIFREYDIRGVVPEQLNPTIARMIGHAFARMVANAEQKKSPIICVAWDGRLSSPELKNAINEGLLQGGAEVLEIGLGPTPLAYFSVFELDADGCVMITGSHNPPDHNGLKLMIDKRPFFGEQIQQLYTHINDATLKTDAPGQITKPDIWDSYLQALVKAAGPMPRPLNVVWDCGNGASGDVIRALTNKLTGRHDVLFGEIDGTFPNHHPDPSVAANMQDLKARVVESDADIGFAFDGDGDRIGVVDNLGRIWPGDQILAVLAGDVLKHYPNAPIIADVKTSQGVFDWVQTCGGQPVMYKTGHSNVKSKLKEIGAPLAGEMSGHIFFNDEYYGIDDAIYAACRLMRILSAESRPASDYLDALPIWHSTPEMRVACEDERKFDIIQQIAAQLKAENIPYSDIDGVRVQLDQGWWLLRASNTQPVLVARAEARNKNDLPALVSQLNSRLLPFGITL